jgi:TonB family protein
MVSLIMHGGIRAGWLFLVFALALIPGCAGSPRSSESSGPTGQHCTQRDIVGDTLSVTAFLDTPLQASSLLSPSRPDTLLLWVSYDSTGVLSRIRLYSRPGDAPDLEALADELRTHFASSGTPRSYAYGLLVRQESPEVLPYRIQTECRPRLLNAPEVSRRLSQLQSNPAGRNRSARVWVFVNTAGLVERAHIHRSSGSAQADALLLDVARFARFTPALSGDFRVPVWVQVPLTIGAPIVPGAAEPAP